MPIFAAGFSHSLLLLKNGRVCSWGFGPQLGLPGVANPLIPPRRINQLAPGAIGIAAGAGTSLAIVGASSTLWTWGSNAFNELGLPGSLTNLPTEHPRLFGVKSVDGGNHHTLAIHKDGAVAAWGANNAGQLGNGPPDPDGHYMPRHVLAVPTRATGRRIRVDENLQGAESVAAGSEFSLALMRTGQIVSWGDNVYSQLGRPTPNGTNSSTPGYVGRLTGIQKIAAGGSHALALDESGQVFSWGRNEYGQLGRPILGNLAEQVPDFARVNKRIVDIAAGENFSLFLDDQGRIWSCGINAFGELGRSGIALTHDHEVKPVLLSEKVLFTAITAGSRHALAIDTKDKLWSWGNNAAGQLGVPWYGPTMVTYHPFPRPIVLPDGSWLRR